MSSDPRAPVTEYTITPKFSPRRVVFTYRGVISEAGIKTLCEYIDLAVDLYQPKHLAVELDSPGGSALALDYWLYRVQQWGKSGVEIDTLADTVCASAAALALAFGPVGRRFAHPLTKLHFHNPRVLSSGPTEFQEHHAEDFARALKASRTRMHSRLESHLIGSLGKAGFLRTLQLRSQWLLSDSCSVSSTNWTQIRFDVALRSEPTSAIETWANQPNLDSEYADSTIAAWERCVAEMFARDRPVDLRYAWALVLIDASDHLPPLIERTPTSGERENDGHRLPSIEHALVSHTSY